jgi:hypothetical protein
VDDDSLSNWGQWSGNPGDTWLPVDYILNKPPELPELRETLARCLDAHKT